MSGKFGERWAEIAMKLMARRWLFWMCHGEKPSIFPPSKLLKKNPDTRAYVSLRNQHRRRSSHSEVGALIKNYSQTLLLVDAITALGAYSIPWTRGVSMAWLLQLAKSFYAADRTGFGFLLCLKAWTFVDAAKTPRFYF